MKHTFTRIIALLLASLTAHHAAEPPNVILILSDDQGFTDY